jgi:hypothetical protein
MKIGWLASIVGLIKRLLHCWLRDLNLSGKRQTDKRSLKDGCRLNVLLLNEIGDVDASLQLTSSRASCLFSLDPLWIK